MPESRASRRATSLWRKICLSQPHRRRLRSSSCVFFKTLGAIEQVGSKLRRSFHAGEFVHIRMRPRAPPPCARRFGEIPPEFDDGLVRALRRCACRRRRQPPGPRFRSWGIVLRLSPRFLGVVRAPDTRHSHVHCPGATPDRRFTGSCQPLQVQPVDVPGSVVVFDAGQEASGKRMSLDFRDRP